VRGEILLKRDPGAPGQAEGAFLAAIAVAKHQGTRSFELRAALPLAKFYRATDRHTEGQAVLASALEGFPLTLKLPEMREALEIFTPAEPYM